MYSGIVENHFVGSGKMCLPTFGACCIMSRVAPEIVFVDGKESVINVSKITSVKDDQR